MHNLRGRTWGTRFYDGRSGRVVTARLHLPAHTPDLELVADADASVRTIPRGALRLEAALGSAARVARLDDGGRLEFEPGADLGPLEEAIGPGERPWLTRWERSLPLAVGSALALLLVVFLGFRFGVPMAAEGVAGRLNDDIRGALGRQTLRTLDRVAFEPSRMPSAERARIRRAFGDVVARLGDDAPESSLVFRKSRIGPNAMALPGDTIVLTDELVDLYDGDDPVLAVLLHELGHVRHRHALRAALHRASLTALVTFVLGDVVDVLSLAGALPTMLVETGYSRAFEREADTYALQGCAVSGLGAEALVTAFEGLLAETGSRDRGWLSTHPGLGERVERARTFLGTSSADPTAP